MADIIPFHLAVSPSTASPGDEIIFTWNWDPTPQNETESLVGRGFRLQGFTPDGDFVKEVNAATSLTNPYAKISFSGIPVSPYYLEYRVYATQWQWGGNSGNSGGEPLLGGPSNTVRVYDSRRPAEPEPPAADSGARLEQFQNSGGEDIYPRTILEGIFRRSDGKSLEELLAALTGSVPDIKLPLSIENGGTGFAAAEDGLAALIEGSIATFPSTHYTNMYLPVSVGGKCYKVPFTSIQKWTVGDRASSASQANSSYSSFIARGIAAGTSDYTAGSTSMTDGTIYVVYE